jgi:excisionase family DNA binding protein
MSARPSIIPMEPWAANYSPEFLTPKEAAEILRISVGTLEVWRRTGAQNLRFYRRGRNILYDRQGLYEFMSRLKVGGDAN